MMFACFSAVATEYSICSRKFREPAAFVFDGMQQRSIAAATQRHGATSLAFFLQYYRATGWVGVQLCGKVFNTKYGKLYNIKKKQS